MKYFIFLLLAFLISSAGNAQSIKATKRLPSPQTTTKNDVGTSQLLEQGLKALDNKDYEKAAKFFEQAANQGNAEAQFWIGLLYDNGDGVYMNKETAVMWYRKSAEQGYVDAQVNLARCFGLGIGVPQDENQAVYWLRKAAEKGDIEAKEQLKSLGY